MRHGVIVLCLCGLFALASCSDSAQNRQSDLIEADVSGATMQLASPLSLLGPRAVNSGNLELDIRIDGDPIPANRIPDSDDWSARATFEDSGTVLLSVTWFENFQGNRRLDLAHWQESVLVDGPEQIQIGVDEYNTSENLASNGVQLDFDFDDDGSTNLEERRANSNPLSNVSTPADIPPVDVIIPVSTFRSPNVDGSYSAEDYETQNASFRDTDNNRLSIDNLMLDVGTASPLPSRSDGTTEMRWFAIHDNTYLYLAVLGEDVQLSTLHRDSENVWDDDTIDIFIDSDNSKGDTYDGVNDFHVLIPLLDESGDRNDSDSDGGNIILANNSAPLDTADIEFATCGGCGTRGQHMWEVRLPLSTLGLQVGTAFGLEIQLNIDHDGGDRDVKWGWAHPSGSDTAWRDPSTFGTAFLQ